MAEREAFEAEADPQQQIRQILGVVKKGWLVLLTMLGVGLLIGVALYEFLPKSYISTAKIVLRSSWMFEYGTGEQKSLDDLPFATRARLLEEELKSSLWVEAVLDKLEWPDWARAKLGDEGTRHKYVDRVQQRIHARVATGETGERMIVLEFGWTDRILARDFLRALCDHWLNTAMDYYQTEVNRRVEAGQELLLTKQQALENARLDLERFETRHGINALTQHQDLQARSDNLGLQIDTKSAEIASLQKQEELIERQLKETDANGNLLVPPDLSGTSDQPNVEREQLEAELAQVYATVTALKLQGFTLKWPALKAGEDRLAELMTKVSALKLSETVAGAPLPNPKYEEIRKELNDTKVLLEGAIAQNESMQGTKKDLDTKLSTLPQVLREHQTLLQNVAVAAQIATSQQIELTPYLDKKQMLERKGAGRMLPYTHLEPPVPAPSPSTSTGWLALAISTFMGLAIAVAIVIGKELLRSSFVHADQLRRTLRLPVLGEVAPIQTVLEVRRARLLRSLQLAASLMLLFGLGAAIWVCVAHPENLPQALVHWAADMRDGLS